MRHPLTHRQELALAYMTMAWSRNGRWPTLREMCEHFGWWSRNTAAHYVERLVAKGWLTKAESAKGRQYTIPTYRGVTGG